MLFGFYKYQNITLHTIKTVKQNIARTLLTLSNNYSTNRVPKIDFI